LHVHDVACDRIIAHNAKLLIDGVDPGTGLIIMVFDNIRENSGACLPGNHWGNQLGGCKQARRFYQGKMAEIETGSRAVERCQRERTFPEFIFHLVFSSVQSYSSRVAPLTDSCNLSKLVHC
jgi:hypothetical protein